MSRWENLLAVHESLKDVEKSSFDGNLTLDVSNWVFPTETFSVLSERTLGALSRITAEGNLAWVFVPPAGYRL